MAKSMGGPTLKLDVWISPEGYVLRERVPVSFEEAGQRFKATLALDYLDVGRPQQVELPDDDEVQDVTGQAVREANG